MKILIIIFCILGMGERVAAQWSGSGSDIYYDSGKVGVGTANPTDALHVRTTDQTGEIRIGGSNGPGNGRIFIQADMAANSSYIDVYGDESYKKLRIDALPLLLNTTSGGNIGIGTTAPANRLSIQGNDNQLNLGTSAMSQNAGIFFSDGTPTTPANYKWEVYKKGNNDFSFYNYVTGTSNLLIQSGTGNVGINTSSPTEKLAVNGKIRAKEVRVEADWADFVFEPSYKLPTLNDTELFIKKNGRLPEIPSATEVRAHGIDLGEMNSKLLQKIEELTLHLIAMDKKLKQQGILTARQQKEIQQLKLQR